MKSRFYKYRFWKFKFSQRTKDSINCIITFGASGRIKSEQRNYENIWEEMKDLLDQMEAEKKEINTLLNAVVIVKTNSVRSLNKINNIAKNIKGKERKFFDVRFQGNSEELSFEYIDTSLSLANYALDTTKSVGVGLFTRQAAYFLAGKFAKASTGTSLSSLSGAAKTKTILAWFGKGSIATGGGGAAAGTVVLGGITLISAVAVMALYNHWSANKIIKNIKEKEHEVRKTIDNMKRNLLLFEMISKRGNELGLALQKANEVFDVEYEKAYKTIYPIPFISKMIKTIKKALGFNYYSEKDYTVIAYLGKVATNLAKLIDTNVLDS